MKKRFFEIDFLRFFGPLLITNSHFELLYPNEIYATGGAIGDVIFFFISGFTLSLSNIGSFYKWFSKRVRRIYPSIFAWAIISYLIFNNERNIIDIIINGGGWFIKCLFIYYLIFFIIPKYFSKYKIHIYVLLFFCSVLYPLIVNFG